MCPFLDGELDQTRSNKDREVSHYLFPMSSRWGALAIDEADVFENPPRGYARTPFLRPCGREPFKVHILHSQRCETGQERLVRADASSERVEQ